MSQGHVDVGTVPSQLQGDVGARLLTVPVTFARVDEQNGDGLCRDKKDHGVGNCAPCLPGGVPGDQHIVADGFPVPGVWQAQQGCPTREEDRIQRHVMRKAIRLRMACDHQVGMERVNDRFLGWPYPADPAKFLANARS